MTAIEIIREMNNAIQRVKLIKNVDNDGKTRYEVFERDKIHWTETTYPYKRVDFAVKKYLFLAGGFEPVRAIIEDCRRENPG